MALFNRLNGSQRLWVVFAGLYFLPVAIIVAASFPTERQILSDWRAMSSAAVLETNPSFPLDEFNGLSDAEFVRKARDFDFYAGTERSIDAWLKQDRLRKKLAALDKSHKAELANLNGLQLQTVGWGFLFWIVPCLALYGFGWLARWVYRGFKPN